jgi:negative regulator of replication initiation
MSEMLKNGAIEKNTPTPIASIPLKQTTEVLPFTQTETLPATLEDDNLITNTEIKTIYSEVLDNVKKDREEISDILNKFLDLALNSDSSGPTKEAVVNLIKAKSDANDKIIRIADLMTRIKLKDKDTLPKYLAAHQNNTYNIGSSQSEEQKKLLLEEIEKATKKEKKK